MLSSPLRGRQCYHFQAKVFMDEFQVAHHQDSADFYVHGESGQAILIHAVDVATLDDLQNLTELGPYTGKLMPQECQRFLMSYRNGKLDSSPVSQLESQAASLTFEEVVLEPEARICALSVVCRNPQTGALSLPSDTAFHLAPGLNPSAQKESRLIRRICKRVWRMRNGRGLRRMRSWAQKDVASPLITFHTIQYYSSRFVPNL